MSDFKSKLPDFKEVSAIATKLFKDVKTSIAEIIVDYKKKHAEKAAAEPEPTKTEEEKVAKSTKTQKRKKPEEKKGDSAEK